MTNHRRKDVNRDRDDSVFAAASSDAGTKPMGLPGNDMERIAGVLFRTTGIHPSVISFAKSRAAGHWGPDEDQVDLLITAPDPADG